MKNLISMIGLLNLQNHWINYMRIELSNCANNMIIWYYILVVDLTAPTF